MTEREALMLALKALQSDDYWTHVEAVNAIHKALAQPEQEPDDLTIAYMSGVHDGKKQRTWVGLTEEEVESSFKETGMRITPDRVALVKLIIKKIKDKTK